MVISSQSSIAVIPRSLYWFTFDFFLIFTLCWVCFYWKMFFTKQIPVEYNFWPSGVYVACCFFKSNICLSGEKRFKKYCLFSQFCKCLPSDLIIQISQSPSSQPVSIHNTMCRLLITQGVWKSSTRKLHVFKQITGFWDDRNLLSGHTLWFFSFLPNM